jgi:pimeloyl-ACP methyl ester carboxylesterase
VLPHALCGSIQRPWDPARPSAGTITVGFAFVRATDHRRHTHHRALGTLVPHEGGPGYSTTGTGASYAAMYGPLLRRRNLLLVDQRGTGRSEPIDCPSLQNLTIAYRIAAAQCAARLGSHNADYTTARSADDVSAVISALRLGKVDLYGDSYGTFFTQVFAGRHPDQVRSVILDSAYPAYGEGALYPTQGPAMRKAFELVCARSLACRDGGLPFETALQRVLAIVRVTPWHGVSHDADGRTMRVSVDGASLVSVAFGATYAPAWYRELTAALRSALAGDRAPLLRLVAEATGGGTDAGDPSAYSEGLDAAVSCHDYPQLYDMTAPPGAARETQYAAALAAAEPGPYGPFSVKEYADSDWQELDWCTRWPVAPADNRAAAPVPPSGHYPAVPVLVLSGELDSITTAAEGALVTRQFPRARQVLVRNSFHVTAVGDTDGCAQSLVRTFVRSFAIPRRLVTCAAAVRPVRALGSFPASLSAVLPARGRGALAARRVGHAAALTVADLQDRWWNNYSGSGVGLRGGTWSYSGDDVVAFRLHGIALVPGVRVSGRARWSRSQDRMTVHLRVTSAGPRGRLRENLWGHLRGHWNTRAVGARATLTGRLGGRSVRLVMAAP